MTEKTVADLASAGGKARAAKLTKQRRQEIAQQAIQARWHRGVLTATHEGVLKIGDLEIPCSVLEDGTRLISERGFTKALGGKRGGKHWQRRKENPTGAQVPVFLSARNLSPYIPGTLSLAPILYKPVSRLFVAHGIRAEAFPEICNVFLRAREEGKLLPSQSHIAQMAEVLMRGLARVGIVALIDEATGYQDDRPAKALTAILEAFVAEELQKIVRLFPLAWFKELCRLKGVAFSENMRLPQYFGHIVNDLVYRRLAPGILAELRRKNPITESGRRKAKNYQWLTPDHGHPKVLQLLGSQITLAKLSKTWDEFMALVNKMHPVYQDMPLLEMMEGDKWKEE